MDINNQVKLQSIANILLINIQHMNKVGLLDGRMGAALFFYNYGRYTNEQFYGDFADTILDSIIENVRWNISRYDIWAGIGLGVEYLLVHNFVDGNSDELLEDFDSILLNRKINDLSPILSLYIDVRRHEHFLDLCDLLRLQKDFDSQFTITESTANCPLDLINIVWEGLDILDQIVNE